MTYQQFVKWAKENCTCTIRESMDESCVIIDTRNGKSSGITWYIHDNGNVWVTCDSYGDAVINSSIRVGENKSFAQIKELIKFINK